MFFDSLKIQLHMADLESEKNLFIASSHRVMSCAKNHSDPKRKSEDGHMDKSDFFTVRNALSKENHIIFILSLDDLDSLHGKLPLHAVKVRILQANYWELEST
jgi:hypothetical protein